MATSATDYTDASAQTLLAGLPTDAELERLVRGHMTTLDVLGRQLIALAAHRPAPGTAGVVPCWSAERQIAPHWALRSVWDTGEWLERPASKWTRWRRAVARPARFLALNLRYGG